jgi:hypothetical protein
MRNKTFLKTISAVLISAFLVAILPLKIQAALNNSNVISDYNFSFNNPMSAAEINNFLIDKGSRLANYVVPEYVDVPYPLASGGLGTVSSRQVNDLNSAPFYGKTVAQLIYDESAEHNINPRVVLATLQKESSAITGDVFRSSTVASWPMFYMYDETMASCLNSGTNCDDSAYRQISADYGGIGRQLGYSIAWFGTKYSQYKSTGRPLKNGSGQIIGYEQYSDPISIDNQTIECQTAGTRILYLYTPHIQTSFYTIFSSYFGDPSAAATIGDDTTIFSLKTYSGSLQISGSKSSASKVFYGDTLVADLNTNSWVISPTPAIGNSNIVLSYRNENGTEINQKIIYIARHKIADINGDGSINITDLAIFAENWGKSSPAETMVDLNSDAAVDITDLAILAENWGK